MQVFIVCNYCGTLKGCDDDGDIQPCLDKGCDEATRDRCKGIALLFHAGEASKRSYPCALCQYKHDQNTISFASDE